MNQQNPRVVCSDRKLHVIAETTKKLLIPKIEDNIFGIAIQAELIGQTHTLSSIVAMPVGHAHYIVGSGGRLAFEVKNLRIVMNEKIRLSAFELIPGTLSAAAEQIHGKDGAGRYGFLQHGHTGIGQFGSHTG